VEAGQRLDGEVADRARLSSGDGLPCGAITVHFTVALFPRRHLHALFL